MTEKYKQLKIETDPVVFEELDRHKHKLRNDMFYLAKIIADRAIGTHSLDEHLKGGTRAEVAERFENFHFKLMQKVVELLMQLKSEADILERSREFNKKLDKKTEEVNALKKEVWDR
tara:strand:+ start:1739 stop:2089 length:351 start_codon:yes stop_codon:yes gene_type:complete